MSRIPFQLQILFDRYELMNHMHALKRYLMLGQGDLIQVR